jgi:hypothetical protein
LNFSLSTTLIIQGLTGTDISSPYTARRPTFGPTFGFVSFPFSTNPALGHPSPAGRMNLMFRFTLLMAFLVVEGLSGKDTNYYRLGASNPNVNEKMYWRDSFNVLEDLSEFSHLYVKFHSCA